MTSASGSRLRSTPGRRILGASHPRTDEDHIGLRHPAVDQHRPGGRQPDGRYPAVLHTGQADGALHGQERRLTDIDIAPDSPVDIGPGGGQDHARRQPLGPLALSAHNYTVGQGLAVDPKLLLGRRRVRDGRVDLDHADFVPPAHLGQESSRCRRHKVGSEASRRADQSTELEDACRHPAAIILLPSSWSSILLPPPAAGRTASSLPPMLSS